MVTEEKIQQEKDRQFPIPEEGRCLECACGAAGFEMGARWAVEQMMREAVEVKVKKSPLNGPLGISVYCSNFSHEHPFYHCKEGDKLKIIIVKD